MQFKIDENLHDDVASQFSMAGFDVHTVHTEGLRGTDDVTLSEHCKVEERVLITLDLDFADIRAFPPDSYPGLIVVRVKDQSRQHVLKIISQIIPLLDTEPIEGRLWIVSESGVRIRE